MIMRTLILGATGLLGHQLAIQLMARGADVIGTIRGPATDLARFAVISDLPIIGGVDATDFKTIQAAINRAKPDVIVNCIGARGAVLNDSDHTMLLNAHMPHFVNNAVHARNIRFIHISSDGVFSGAHGPYDEGATPDPSDLYGRSKLAGEVSGPKTLCLRLSIIGRELTPGSSLLEWAIAQAGQPVRGFDRVMTTALSAPVLARFLDRLIFEHPELNGLWHLAGPPVSKYDLLALISQGLGLGLKIARDSGLVIDRRLVGERLAARTGFKAPDWPDMIREFRS
jgi:dTDP-4-dehydrorhamnose reductase